MYLIDANIILEVLYKRGRWEESLKLLNLVKESRIRAYILRFTVHGIAAILGKPNLVAKFLSEIQTWRGLTVADLTLEEEILACELGDKIGLDFDDSLQYYFAKKKQTLIISYDRDFDKTDIKRVEPNQVLSDYTDK
ncbi:MAG: PIN domain-containing protein [Sulfolobales archaeon]